MSNLMGFIVSLAVRIAGIVLIVMGLSACTTSTGSVVANAAKSSANEIQTASVDSPDSKVTSDKLAIQTRVVDAAKTEKPELALAWANDETGNSGTITAIEEAIRPDGKRCYKFLATLETFTGITLYDGETCELYAGKWVMSLFRSKEPA